MRASTPVALLLSAALLAGCSGDDEVDDLREGLAARERAEADLLERLEELEKRLDSTETEEAVEPVDPEALDGLEEQLNELSGSLSGLEDQVASERATREEVAAELEATAGDLRSTLSELRGALDELRGEVEDLRVRYEILQQRVDENSDESG